MIECLAWWVLGVLVISLYLPFVVYQLTKVATVAFFRGRDLYEEEKENGETETETKER